MFSDFWNGQGGDASSMCHTLRRHDALFDLFASSVAMEISWADATSGTRNTPIYMCRQIQDNKEGAMVAFVRALDLVLENIEADTMGIPLMRIHANMCVSSNGVLVMGKDGNDAVYVLDMLNGFNAQGRLDLSHVKSIHITRTFSERDEAGIAAAKDKEKQQQAEILKTRGGTTKLVDTLL